MFVEIVKNNHQKYVKFIWVPIFFFFFEQLNFIKGQQRQQEQQSTRVIWLRILTPIKLISAHIFISTPMSKI